jgi:hypothetical protein
MCDYGTDPVWLVHEDGTAVAVPLDDLPITRSTRDQIRRWAGKYEALFASDFSWAAEDEDAFESDGVRLAHTLRAELSNEWEVGYFSEREQKQRWLTR